MEHTPGPWRVKANAAKILIEQTDEQGRWGLFVADCSMLDEGLANATLMAASPEMLATLEWYAEQAAGCRKLGSVGDPYRRALDADGGKRARDAITKAKFSDDTPQDDRIKNEWLAP